MQYYAYHERKNWQISGLNDGRCGCCAMHGGGDAPLDLELHAAAGQRPAPHPLPELRRRRIEAALVNDNVRITPIR